jgi:hypothetical protein
MSGTASKVGAGAEVEPSNTYGWTGTWACRPAWGERDVHPLLPRRQAEARPAPRVEGDDLAIENDLAAGRVVEQRAES